MSHTHTHEGAGFADDEEKNKRETHRCTRVSPATLRCIVIGHEESLTATDFL